VTLPTVPGGLIPAVGTLLPGLLGAHANRDGDAVNCGYEGHAFYFADSGDGVYNFTSNRLGLGVRVCKPP